MTPSTPIIVVGSINRDHMIRCHQLPLPGQTVHGQSITWGGGGKGANQAFAAAQLGGDVAMIGAVGGDAYGSEARAALANAGCDVGGVRTIGATSGQAIVLVQDDGTNSIVVIEGANGLFDRRELLGEADRLSRAAIVLLQLEIPFETVVEAAALARRAGSHLILDPAPAAVLPERLLQSVDIVTPNQTELAAMSGRQPGDRPAIAEAARALRARGTDTVIVKLGAEGCLLVDSDGERHLAAPVVDAVDTTGAGDIFNGALAVALSEGREIAEACRFAIAAAAISVTRRGAQAATPTRAEADTMFRNASTHPDR
ncbi:ribokinase [Sphingopyxis lindanitolerans]|nr:ribokinase [Sphingopyxis lindanitolerans]